MNLQKIKQLLGRHEMSRNCKKIASIFGIYCVTQILLILVFKQVIFPPELTRLTLVGSIGVVMLYWALEWPGMAIAIPFILLPNLMLEGNESKLFLWLVVVPSALFGLFLIGWSGDFLAKIKEKKH